MDQQARYNLFPYGLTFKQLAQEGGGVFNGTREVSYDTQIYSCSSFELNLERAGRFRGCPRAGGGLKIPDCRGNFSSLGYNLIGRNDGCSGFVNGVNADQVGSGANPIDPLLAALADNGGSTQTRALLPGSPAINAGNPLAPGSGGFACAAGDQRGIARPQGSQCDIGAFEVELRSMYLPLIRR